MTFLKSSTSSAVSISKPRLSTTASLAIRLIKSSSLVLSRPELCFHPDSERLTDFLEMRLSDADDGGESLGKYCEGDGVSSSDVSFFLRNRGCVDSGVVVDVGDHECPSFTNFVSGVVVEPSTPCIMVEG